MGNTGFIKLYAPYTSTHWVHVALLLRPFRNHLPSMHTGGYTQACQWLQWPVVSNSCQSMAESLVPRLSPYVTWRWWKIRRRRAWYPFARALTSRF